MEGDTGTVDVAVVGVGRMGRLHALTFGRLPEANLVAVVDTDEERRETVVDEVGCAAFADCDQLFSAHPRLRAASIAVPTAQHEAVAAPFLTRGIACLVEKPFALDVLQARALAHLSDRHGAILQVGHTERFNPAIRAVAAMDVTPRFMEVNRISPMTFRSLDIGVIMDMMIHDLDIVLNFADSPLKSVVAAGVAVLGEHEDVANARLEFESGCVANLTASRLALKTERKMRLFSEEAYVSLDYQKRSGVLIRKSGNAEALAKVREQIDAGADLSDLDYSTLVTVEELTMDLPEGHDDPLTAELSSFLEAVRTARPPDVDARAGCAAIEAGHRVVEAVQQHRWEGLAGARV